MIKGEKVLLRPLKESDWEKTLEWRNSMEIRSNAMMHFFPITQEQEKSWYQRTLNDMSDRFVYFAIESLADAELVGYVFLKNINQVSQNCTLGIILGNKVNQGKGFGTETMQLIESYAFHFLNLKKISLEVVAFNHAAVKLYKKVGYVTEGTLKKHFYFNGQYHDVHIMSLFRDGF